MFNIDRNNYFENPKPHDIFTPGDVIDKIFKYIDRFYNRDFPNILENSFGKGNILVKLVEKFPNSKIIGYEIREDYYRYVSYLKKVNLTIHNENFLTAEVNNNFDLILSNPPFSTPERRGAWRDFLDKSFDLLTKNGIMIFILPSYWKQNTDTNFKKFVKYFPPVNFLPIFKSTFFNNSLSCDIVIIDKGNKNNFWENIYC